MVLFSLMQLLTFIWNVYNETCYTVRAMQYLLLQDGVIWDFMFVWLNVGTFSPDKNEILNLLKVHT